jgi:hypothetical protein
MAGTRREIWKDPVSGRLWAVELLRDRVVGCCGPLDPRGADATSIGGGAFERDRSMLRALDDRRDRFMRAIGSDGVA